MKRVQRVLTAAILTLSISTVALGGTITGSRSAARVGTITGSKTGTITGSRTGTITGSRTGVSDTLPSRSTKASTIQDDVISRLALWLLNFAW